MGKNLYSSFKILDATVEDVTSILDEYNIAYELTDSDDDTITFNAELEPEFVYDITRVLGTTGFSNIDTHENVYVIAAKNGEKNTNINVEWIQHEKVNSNQWNLAVQAIDNATGKSFITCGKNCTDDMEYNFRMLMN